MPVEDKFLAFLHIFRGNLSIKTLLIINDWRIISLTILAVRIRWRGLRLLAYYACVIILILIFIFETVLDLNKLTIRSSSTNFITLFTSWRFLPNRWCLFFDDCVLSFAFLIPWRKRGVFICLMNFRLLWWSLVTVAHCLS